MRCNIVASASDFLKTFAGTPANAKANAAGLAGLPQTPKQMPRDLRELPQTPKHSPRDLRELPQTPKQMPRDLRELPQTPKQMPWYLRSLRKRLGKCRETCAACANVSVNAAGLARLAQTPKYSPRYLRNLRKRLGKCRGTQRNLRKRFSNSYRQNTTRTNPTLGARPCLTICTGEGGMSLPSRSRLTYSLPPRGSPRSGRQPWPRKYPGRR